MNGESAISGISNALGRDGIGYFELRGVPMNAYEEKVINILSNNELKTIIDILELDMTSDKKPDSNNWYSIEIDNTEYIVNENDDILIDGYYYSVQDILREHI